MVPGSVMRGEVVDWPKTRFRLKEARNVFSKAGEKICVSESVANCIAPDT